MMLPIEEKVDVEFKHPFTSIIVGPSGCGKSTFVKDLILNQNDLISTCFETIYIFLGTPRNENKILCDLENASSSQVKIIELGTLYPHGLKKSSFKEDFSKIMSTNSKNNSQTCVIFDDLMSELSEIHFLDEMFTKWSSHANMSVIHITQNLFHKTKGNSSCASTLYRNNKVLVLFNSPMDQTTLRIVCSRLAKERNSKDLMNMLSFIVDKYRYVVIRANLQTPEKLRFTTDLFAQKPVRHMKCFTLHPKKINKIIN